MGDRPTKKQRELLSFIDNFIAGHGYGPSYREIMSGMGYKSVATVALHIDNLIAKGQLKKRSRSARSLEVIDSNKTDFKMPKTKPSDEKWLVEQIEQRFLAAESGTPSAQLIDELYVLTGTLRILGFDGAADSFTARLSSLNRRSN